MVPEYEFPEFGVVSGALDFVGLRDRIRIDEGGRVALGQIPSSTVGKGLVKGKSSVPIDCCLDCWSDDARLQQLYTGLASLHHEGRIRLRQRLIRDPARFDLQGVTGGSGFARVTLNGKTVTTYDVGDQGTINEPLLAKSDIYFKRSFSEAAKTSSGSAGSRVQPLGLNYPVYRTLPDRFALARAAFFGGWRSRAGQLVRLVDVAGWCSSLPREKQLDAKPDPGAPPRVLFLVRAWNAEDFPGCTPERIAQFNAINDMRAACVRALRSAFGPMFTGGFSHTEFARKYYPDALASNSAMTSKRRYLALLREHPICVATTGLHQSIGWKMGEYVALSKAVIAEKLHFEVPGPFADGINYLGFTTPEECVDKVQELVGSPDRRASLMQANRSYFETWLRPAALVWNSLAKAKGMKSAGELTE